LATRRTQHRSHRWWSFLNLVLIHRFSIVGVGTVQLRIKQTMGDSEMGHLLLSHSIPKTFDKNDKEDILEIVPHIEVVNHLGIGQLRKKNCTNQIDWTRKKCQDCGPGPITISRPMTIAIVRIATPLESERSVATSTRIINTVTQLKR
jgi:hypothetical protein